MKEWAGLLLDPPYKQRVRVFIGHPCRVFKFLYLLMLEPAGDAEVFACGFDEVGGGE
jgi:hypothetical protein